MMLQNSFISLIPELRNLAYPTGFYIIFSIDCIQPVIAIVFAKKCFKIFKEYI